MPGNLIEHVIEETDAGRQLRLAGTGQIKFDANLRFQRGSVDVGRIGSWQGFGGKGCKWNEMVSWPRLPTWSQPPMVTSLRTADVNRTTL
ncbi:MAG: hypothetical protein KJ702_14520, partial [Gammaproteobacteria bacterium]|nr:hypothetical protein [Gammaproteobacteria bacterium]